MQPLMYARVPLGCSISPLPADRGRRRPRARAGNLRVYFIVLVLVVVLDCFPRLADRGRRRPRARSRNSRVLIVLVVLRPRFLHRQQTEHDDDHEGDQEKSRRFFIVHVLVVMLDCPPRRADRGGRRRFGCDSLDPPRGSKANARGSSAPARAEQHKHSVGTGHKSTV